MFRPAFGDDPSMAISSSGKHALQPSDLLKLKKNNHSNMDGTTLRKLESCRINNHAPPQPRSPSKEAVPQGYVIPQRRIALLKSSDLALKASAEPLNKNSNNAFWDRFWKEKLNLVGGLSKEDELRAIWAKFDEEERRQRFKSNPDGGENVVSGNDVLGAWENESLLRDLSRDV